MAIYSKSTGQRMRSGDGTVRNNRASIYQPWAPSSIVDRIRDEEEQKSSSSLPTFDIGSKIGASAPKLQFEEPIQIGKRDTTPTRIYEEATEKAVEEPTFLERVGKTLSGAGKKSGSGLVNTQSTLFELGQGQRDRMYSDMATQYKKEYEQAQKDLSIMERENREKPGTYNDAEMRGQRYILEDAQRKYEALSSQDVKRAQQGAVKETQSIAVRLAESGQKDTERAKQGLGTVGKLAVDVGTGMTQLAADAALGTVTGLGTAGTIALRGFGSGAQQARQEGATLGQQIAYGLGSATVEALTEKIGSVGNFNTKLFGKGAFDDILEGVVAAVERAAKTETGAKFLNRLTSAGVGFLSEGIEEFVSGVVDPVLRKATYAQDESIDWKQTLQDSAYDFLVGGVIGSLMSGVGGTDTSKHAATRTNNAIDSAYDAMKQNGMFSDAGTKALSAAKTEMAWERMRNGGTDTSGAVDTSSKTAYNKPVETVSPAASSAVKQTAAQAEKTRIQNPESDVLDAATTAWMGLGMNLKTAKQRAEITQKLIRGEEVSVREINKLDPTNKEAQKVFSELTGVQFPDTKMPLEQTHNLFRSASTVAQTAQMAQEAAQERSQMQAAERAKVETEIAQMGAEVAQAVQEQAENAPVTQSEDVETTFLNADGAPLATLQEFTTEARAKQPDLSPAQISEGYNRYVASTATVEQDGKRLNLQEFAAALQQRTGAPVSTTEATEQFLATAQQQSGQKNVVGESKVTQKSATGDTVSFSEFMDAYRAQVDPNVTREEAARQYEQYLNDATGAERHRFAQTLRSAPGGEQLTEEEIDQLFELAQGITDYKEDNYGQTEDPVHRAGLHGLSDQRSRGQSRGVPGETGRAEGEGGARREDRAGRGVQEGSREESSSVPREVRQEEKRLSLESVARHVTLSDGTEALEVVREAYTPEMQEQAKKFAFLGIDVRVLVNGYPIPGTALHADGVSFLGSETLLRANSFYGIDRIGDHELVHQVFYVDPELRIRVFEAFEESVTDETFKRLLDAYAPSYQEAYKDSDNSMDDIIEEIVADAYAGIDRYGAGAPQFQSAVRAVLDPWIQTKTATYRAELALTDDAGNLVVESNDTGFSRFSMSTFKDSGRDILSKWLDQAVLKGDLTQKDADDILNTIDAVYEICDGYKEDYGPFSAWSDAKVVVNENGDPVFSVVKANGDYAMNLDFSLVCKKRRTLDAVLNELVRRGFADNLALGQEDIVRINDVIRDHGFETACALCFVDAKRFRQGKVADDFVKLYNDLVLSLIPEQSGIEAQYFNFGGDTTVTGAPAAALDQMPNDQLDFTRINEVLKTYGPKTVEHKVAKLLKSSAQDRKLTKRGDFLSTAGFDAINRQNPRVLKLFNAKKGSGGPKSAVSDVQYLNEVLKSRKFNAEKAYAVGGVRVQSFSDYVPRMVFDYVQMIADLSAKKMPAHAYTKEELFVKQFGLTGMKINMSLIPRVAEGGIAAGLDADGNYVWADESFDYDEALKIQSAEGYSRNCGTIAVGVSDAHIRTMMADPEIRMIIPYHKSGLNPIVAKMNKIGAFTDYTDFQNTRHQDGTKLDKSNKADKKLLAEHPDFNQRLHELGDAGDPRQVAEEYVHWCEENNLLPKFDQFAYKQIDGVFVEQDGKRVVDENYYKLLEDFTVYDNGEYVAQTGLTMTFPNENSAFGSMADLIKRGLEEDAVLEGKRDAEVGKIVDEIMKFSVTEEAKNQSPYSYETLVRKPDIVVTQVPMRTVPTRGKKVKTSEVTNEALTGADTLENDLSTQRYVYVADLGARVGIPKKSVNHGLQGNITNSGTKATAEVTYALPAILRNSVAVNELNPRSGADGEYSFILFGLAERTDGQQYLVRSTVNHFSDNRSAVESVEVFDLLKGIKARKTKDPQTEVFNSVSGSRGTQSGLSSNGTASAAVEVIGSVPRTGASFHNASADTISVAELLDVVKENYPELLPKSVREHYGITEPAQDPYARYSLSDSSSYAPTFYSKMEQVVQGVRQEKLGAASVVSMLRGKGVKAEEIKWSGIEAFLKGKKSVTKEELLEFVQTNRLQINEETLDYSETPYTDEQQEEMDYYTKKKGEVTDRLAKLWQETYQEEFPFHQDASGMSDLVQAKIRDKLIAAREEAPEGVAYKDAREAIRGVIAKNDDFGFDTGREAYVYAVRNPREFMENEELSAEDKAVFERFAEAQSAFRAVDLNSFAVGNEQLIQIVADKATFFSKKISDIKSANRAERAKHLPKWGQYRLVDGTNYREYLFSMPNSDYSNGAMYGHWGDRTGILAHARVQDLDVADGKMLFVEEIQSDWHNAGAKLGYDLDKKTAIASVDEQIKSVKDQMESIKWPDDSMSDSEFYKAHEAAMEESQLLEKKLHQLHNDRSDLVFNGTPSSAPYSKTYHEFVLKNLIRKAAEGGYDSIGWTTGQIQEDRWSSDYAEGYRIEYDQDIPKFLSKYGKQWGAKVEKTQLEDGTEIWSMDITDSMKESVLYEGQPRYSIANPELSFADQVDLVRQNKLNEFLTPGTSGRNPHVLTNSAVYVAKEPNSLMQELGYGDLAIVVTQDHLRQMIGKREDADGNVANAHNHQLTPRQVKILPKLLEKPAAVLRAKGRPESLIFVTTEKDYRGRPIIVPIKANGVEVVYDGISGPAHVVTSMYGRDNFDTFFENAVKQGQLVYYKKERIDPILTAPGYQSSGLLSGIDSGTILGEVNPVVKDPGQRKYAITPQFEKWYKETYGTDLTSAQLKRRLQTAERRAAEAEHDKKAAELKNTIDSQMDLTAWMIHHTKKMREQKRASDAKLAEARKAKNEAVRTAIAETKELERAKAELQHDADRMAERRNAAKRLRTQENAYANKVTEMKENAKLKRNAAKAVLRDSRLAAKKRAEIETEQGLVDTIRKNPKQRTGVEKLQDAAQQLRTLGRSAYRNFVNMAESIDRFSKRQVSDMRAGTLVNILGGSASTMEAIFKKGLVDRAGNRIGESMSDVFLCWDEAHKKVNEGQQALLQDFMLHWHNIDRMSIVARAESALETFELNHEWLRDMDQKEFARLVAMTEKEVEKLGKHEAQQQAFEYVRLIRAYNEAQNKPIFADSNGNSVTAETSQRIVDQYLAEQPWLLDKANGIYEWWDLFMRNWAVGDTISEAEYNRMRQMYPHYVPTYRADKNSVGGAGFVGAGGATVSKAVKKAKGSHSEVMNIEDSFSNIVSKIIRLNRLNELYMNIVDTAMLDEDGTFADMAYFDWDWQDGVYANALITGSADIADLTDTVEETEKAGLEKVGSDYKLTGWKDGRKYTAYISEDLYKSIGMVTGHLANDLEQNLLKAGNTLTTPMKTAITGINPTFAIRNLSRDLPTAIINSISGLNFPKYYAQAAKEIVKNSDHWKTFQALGGTHATYYNDNQGFTKAMSRGQNPAAWAVGKMGAFNEITEAQTRFAEYLATVDKLGDTYEARLQGIKNAAEVTVDFSRKGRYGKVINAWVPYWNPAVQGIDKTVRSVIDSPDGSAVWKQASKTLGRAAMTTILFEAILYGVLKALDRDDEWEELNDRTKDTYYCIPLKDSNRFLKIPKNREWGAILGTPFMRMLEWANGREDPFENYIETAIEPNFLPPAIFRPDSGGGFATDAIGISQALDLAKNEDFAGRTIVPYAYQQGTLSQQFDNETSALAKKLGELFNWSPMQIDYIIGDYFGDFGDMFINATSEATWSGEQNIGETALEIVTNPFLADARYSNASVSKYYDLMDDLGRVVQDKKNQMGTDAAKGTIEYQTEKAIDEMYGKQISELNRVVRELPDGTEKDNAKSQIAQLTKEAIEFYNDSMAGKVSNPILTATYNGYSESVAKELTRMDSYSEQYSFKPRTTAPTSYVDPKNKKNEYRLDDEQKDYFKRLYREQYDESFSKLIQSQKYRNAKDDKKAALLEDARDDVLDATKEEFFAWLKKNGVRSTPKAK